MQSIVVNKDWEDDFLYGTKMHHKLMQKYCDYFKKIFKSRINQFGYFRHNQDGRFIAASNWMQHEELYLEHKGYQDDPHHIDFKKIKTGFSFDWPNRHIENNRHNAFRLAIHREFGTYGSICVVEKMNDYYNAFWWGFESNIQHYQKDQAVIMQDFFSNTTAIKKCLNQCKEELFPLLEKKLESKVNFNILKGSYYKKQKPIIRPLSKREMDQLIKFLLISQHYNYKEFQKNFNEKERNYLDYFVQEPDVYKISNLLNIKPITIKRCLTKAINYLLIEKQELTNLLKGGKEFFGL